MPTSSWSAGGAPWGRIVYDGRGSDYVTGGDVTVIAAIDGDDDVFYDVQRVVYLAAHDNLLISPFIGAPGHVSGAFDAVGDGVNDHIRAPEVVGGSGDDYIEGVVRSYGGPGNDFLYAFDGLLAYPSVRPFADGGSGNDTLVADIGGADLWGGSGSDVFLPDYGPSDIWTGSGADLIHFQAGFPSTTVWDLSAHDRITVDSLPNISSEQLFAQGYLQVAHAGGFTLVNVDPDGGGDAFQAFLKLSGNYSQGFLEGVIV